MKKFLRILIVILVLMAIAAIALMFFSPKKMVFDESITIDAPAMTVFNMVNDFKEWESWSPWAEMDPEAINTYTDKSAGVGAKWEWIGNAEVGEGSQTIKTSEAGKFISTVLTFKGWDGDSVSDWNFTPDGEKTKVKWGFDGSETPFVFRPFNLFMKSGLKKTYAKGLNKIKKIAEDRAKNNTYGGYKVNEVYQGTKNYVMNRQVVDIPNISNFFSTNVGALMQKSQGVEMEMDGKPSALFYSWDMANGKTDMAVAIPVKSPVTIPGTITQTLSDGKAIQVDYYGDPDKSEAAHYAIEYYMRDKGLLVNYPIVQETITDPLQEKDMSKWLTRITYYVTNSTQ